ncbi:MAG: PrsW family intramembrane metalloprotease [Spirochaetaceae bacterium]|nr:MAG: PrsW family intramembrane metalloprotease [Spirochaetaceae bacterium]
MPEAPAPTQGSASRMSGSWLARPWAAFATGFLAVWPAMLAGSWLQQVIQLSPRSLPASFLYVALPEEIVKFLLALILFRLLRSPAALVGLGFGISETIFLVSHSNWPIRLLSSVPLHTGTTALAGIGISLLFSTKGNKPESSIKLVRRIMLTLSLLAGSISLHWLYNLSVQNNSPLYWVLAWLAPLLWLSLSGAIALDSKTGQVTQPAP